MQPDNSIPYGPPMNAEMGIDLDDSIDLYDMDDRTDDVHLATENNLEGYIYNISETDPALMRKIMDDVNAHASMLLKTCAPQAFQSREQLRSLTALAQTLGHPKISGIYSPPRVTPSSGRCRFRRGLARVLSVLDPTDGLPWDFTLPSKRAQAPTPIEDESPELLSLNQLRKAFSTLNRRNAARIRERRLSATQDGVRVHLVFAMAL